jgi:hypothetical protein
MFDYNKICGAMPFTNTAVVIPKNYIHYNAGNFQCPNGLEPLLQISLHLPGES